MLSTYIPQAFIVAAQAEASIPWHKETVFGQTIGSLITAFAIVSLTMIFRRIVTHGLFVSLGELAKRTQNEYDDRLVSSLEAPVSTLLLFFGVYTAANVLKMDDAIDVFASRVFLGLTIMVVFWGLVRVLDVVADIFQEIAERKGSTIATFMPLIKKTTRLFVCMVGAVMVIDNLGYSISGIIATLGIGGAAFAFAAKDTIANLYGSLALALDRPFKVGDWIQVGDVIDGDVEEIGLRSTRVRSWPKTVLSIPNHVLANETINNWSEMPKRRVKQYVGVTYSTTADQMNTLVEDIRQLLKEDEGVQQDFILVNFTDFGDSSLQILVYYFTTSIKWLEHMDVRQRVNMKIMRAVEARGLSFAFPTRTLHLASAQGLGAASEPRLPGDFGPQAPR